MAWMTGVICAQVLRFLCHHSALLPQDAPGTTRRWCQAGAPCYSEFWSRSSESAGRERREMSSASSHTWEHPYSFEFGYNAETKRVMGTVDRAM